jgi:hypothetical protein
VLQLLVPRLQLIYDLLEVDVLEDLNLAHLLFHAFHLPHGGLLVLHEAHLLRLHHLQLMLELGYDFLIGSEVLRSEVKFLP